MEKNRGVIRELLKYEFELGHSVKEAIENINRAKGVGTVAQRTAYEWYSKFKSGNLTIEDNPRAGRPREVDRAAVVNAVEEHPSMTTRMLADDFDCSFKEIALILHDAGKKWLKSQWVPKELTTAQKRNRVQIATRLAAFTWEQVFQEEEQIYAGRALLSDANYFITMNGREVISNSGIMIGHWKTKLH
ncbi:histone-lysine N-methyltransferase SETMAR [Ditylenchus destructor]|uniref:Histone-lysine N-methyltransferase SETMAR n=1 Tax=Ditylenchus destructor TaxID=166010 RepID=A0AAD4N878_9BILA|nr:histone-lysine N-methyltransferase SETMAR [Ditylenchus destructor]